MSVLWLSSIRDTKTERKEACHLGSAPLRNAWHSISSAGHTHTHRELILVVVRGVMATNIELAIIGPLLLGKIKG